jgi:endonuclease/exonuclease/phosphatase family metal-dependent hydrolase
MKIGFLKTLLLFLMFSHFFNPLYTQNLEELSFGTDSTFDVITWNIEWFPKNGQTTIHYVTSIIEALEADVMALQEISDTAVFREMADDMENYECFIPGGYHAGLAYLYKKEKISISSRYRIYETEPYWRPFPRSPLIMEFSYDEEEYVVINNHFKCCGDEELNENDSWDEETRRYDASNLLKEYIDANWSEKNVILMGDLNDMLTDDSVNNVFRNILEDTAHYRFADMDIATGRIADWSYPGWPSHLDHILITDELFDGKAYDVWQTQTIKVGYYLEGGFREYEEYVSDHRPVGARFSPDIPTDVNQFNESDSRVEVFPNPFRDYLRIDISAIRSDCQVEIFNVYGKRLKLFQVNGKRKIFRWQPENLEKGLSLIRIVSNGNTIATKKIIKI